MLPWHKEQWSDFSSRVDKGALPHAFLLNGSKGLGKLGFALTVAASLLCESRSSGKFACGSCKQCKLLSAETHPDLRILKPEEGGASIKIDLVRNLVNFISQTSTQGGLKVAVLHPAETLTISAANALLKTLEEPADHSIILLVSNSAGMLLPTIRSRCQLINFDTPSTEVAKTWLEQSFDASKQESDYSEQKLYSLLELASGAPLKAKEYLSEGALEEHDTMLDEMALFLKNELLCSKLAKRWGDDLFTVRLAWTIKWLEKIIHLRMVKTSQLDDSYHGGKMMSYLAKLCGDKALFELHAMSHRQYQQFLGTSNPNKQLAFEFLLNKWAMLMKREG